jgi:hypothetical protein
VVLDKLAQPTFAVQDPLGGPQDIVAVRQETSDIRGRVGRYIKNVPDVRNN